MKRALFKDIINVFVSIPKGLAVTVKNWFFTRPAVTELYPEERRELPERYRGVPSLPVDPVTGRSRCIACGACARICPEQIIKVVPEKGEDPKDRKPAEFTIDISRCMWCGLCSEVCPKDCLKPARDFELACYKREDMIYKLEDLMRLGGILKPEPETEDKKEN
ncbi:MAG: NADH-quinone oxidoreductase subunit I [Armatimonadetes bacterium]|nr:NADH-quinone oxidoreductase subunit I [Armatimonadota bacterium]